MNTQITKLAMIIPATFAAIVTLSGPAHADDDSGLLQSPSGNIVCVMNDDGVDCQIADHTWAAPPRPADCPSKWGDRFRLAQGKPAVFQCHGRQLPFGTEHTLNYGQSHSVGTITCESQPAGITCTDSTTGHFFRVSRESYQLG